LAPGYLVPINLSSIINDVFGPRKHFDTCTYSALLRFSPMDDGPTSTTTLKDRLSGKKVWKPGLLMGLKSPLGSRYAVDVNQFHPDDIAKKDMAPGLHGPMIKNLLDPLKIGSKIDEEPTFGTKVIILWNMTIHRLRTLSTSADHSSLRHLAQR
jgi:hypothetical protein